MSKNNERPSYANEFEKYTMAVSFLEILYEKGMLPEEVYNKIAEEYKKDVAKFKKI